MSTLCRHRAMYMHLWHGRACHELKCSRWKTRASDRVRSTRAIYATGRDK
jgi:hypothetical protein